MIAKFVSWSIHVMTHLGVFGTTAALALSDGRRGDLILSGEVREKRKRPVNEFMMVPDSHVELPTFQRGRETTGDTEGGVQPSENEPQPAQAPVALSTMREPFLYDPRIDESLECQLRMIMRRLFVSLFMNAVFFVWFLHWLFIGKKEDWFPKNETYPTFKGWCSGRRVANVKKQGETHWYYDRTRVDVHARGESYLVKAVVLGNTKDENEYDVHPGNPVFPDDFEVTRFEKCMTFWSDLPRGMKILFFCPEEDAISPPLQGIEPPENTIYVYLVRYAEPDSEREFYVPEFVDFDGVNERVHKYDPETEKWSTTVLECDVYIPPNAYPLYEGRELKLRKDARRGDLYHLPVGRKNHIYEFRTGRIRGRFSPYTKD